jgi:6-pyruvoyl-tetrahydropterin synthase
MNQALNETQIERKVQSVIDRLDRHFLSNQINQEQYDRDMESLDRWAFQELQAWKAQNESAPYRGKETT